MASVVSVDVKDTNNILLNLRISKKEYELLAPATKAIMVISSELFTESLTTGRLGHSNRIMLPKKILKKHGVKILPKKVPAEIFDFVDSKFLVISLVDKKVGVPRFGEDDGES